jgi:hypothetical protein
MPNVATKKVANCVMMIACPHGESIGRPTIPGVSAGRPWARTATSSPIRKGRSVRRTRWRRREAFFSSDAPRPGRGGYVTSGGGLGPRMTVRNVLRTPGLVWRRRYVRVPRNNCSAYRRYRMICRDLPENLSKSAALPRFSPESRWFCGIRAQMGPATTLAIPWFSPSWRGKS